MSLYTRVRRLAPCVCVLALTVCALGTADAAKNIILMVGDGMGYEQVKAGSYYLSGTTGGLCFEQYYKCGVTTYSANSSITDSAAAATALATGHKVNNGVLSQAPNGAPYQTILEQAKAMSKRTGLVTTVPVTHATPAAFGAHELSRNSYTNIAGDYLSSSRPDLIFGGGDPAKSGTTTWFSSAQVSTARSLGYQVAYDASQMNALNPATTDRALGLFAGGDMTYEYERLPDNTQPHLSQMMAKALSFMERDADGFFLMVEGGNIDHAAHLSSIKRTTREVVEFNNSVSTALTWMQGRTDTMLIVVADHETGGLTAINQGAGNYPTATWTGGGDHTGSNVPFYITGANANLVDGYMANGTIDNTDVYRIMSTALTTPVPEPSSVLILIGGIAQIGMIARRTRRQTA